MQKAWTLGAVTLLLLCALSTQADPTYSAQILVPEVEVRSGPSNSASYYATSKLRQGDRVTVVREHDKDWLAIEPPRPGIDSFSWVKSDEVKLYGMVAVVIVPEARVRIGSKLLNQAPSVEQGRVTQGTQLTVIGQAQASADGNWLPIVPPPSEVRYLPVTAVRANTPAPMVAASSPALTTAPAFSQPTFGSAPMKKDDSVTRAEQADIGGNLGEAIRLYEQVARETNDQELKVRCLNRSQFLRDATRQGPAARPVDARLVSVSPEQRLTPTISSPTATAGGYYATTQRSVPMQYCYVPDPCYAVRLKPPVLANPLPPAGPQALWYGPARVHKALFLIDGKQVYRLEPTNGQMWWYATAGAGVDLEQYVARNVYVAGTLSYRPDWRIQYMPALQVSLVK